MGRRFWKMSGSGNDFVVFDVRQEPAGPLERPESIQALCARGTGVGADGVVIVDQAGHPDASLAMRYYNSDGSLGDFCGNATLCVTSLSATLGVAAGGDFRLETGGGVVPARTGPMGPEIDLPAVTVVTPSVDIELELGEQRIGFALAGVPHLVVRTDDVARVDVMSRGRHLRHASFRASGANVNFVSERQGAWSIRTFERGVEGETLACGSGAVAAAILLSTWGWGEDDHQLVTRSGRVLRVRLRRENDAWLPTLAGEGRIVFTGEMGEGVELGR